MIRIRPPVCYLPPIWELILNPDIRQLPKELYAAGPSPNPWAIEAHLKQRINTVNQLVRTQKLDADIAKLAVEHFETHLQELAALRAQK